MNQPVTLPAGLAGSIVRKEPVFWLNPRWQPLEAVSVVAQVQFDEVREAEARLHRFAGLLMQLFPELKARGGIIESAVLDANSFRQAMIRGRGACGRWLIKGDHALPVAGSIKARGGFYEVLLHSEEVALAAGLLKPQDDRRVLGTPEARSLFARHEIAVGSTGNLGLSIGVIAAALGFKATVHMSAEAKAWKKTRLRSHGVEVIEHAGDFGEAVAAGREQARTNPNAYFVDDENSRHLFLGYSVAALRLQPQLQSSGIAVDARRPLFVYLPCGVGGAPGGITFGLRHVFGDHVHCFFAEPVASAGMLIRLASAEDRPVTVRALGLDNKTEADGLAVGQASEFAAPIMRPLVSGIFTVPDEDLFEDLFRLEQSEGLRIEPSAAAGFRGPRWILESDRGREYLANHGLLDHLDNATHILWTTGGYFVPEEEYRQFHERGRIAAKALR